MDVKRRAYDVVVVGAGGAGLRAAIASAEHGARTALVCKSLLGKAHTVMAEGGIAAALGNVDADDNWLAHFQDTMFSGKLLNNWRMAELHAKEAPDRVRELEQWGAVFDRTPDRKMSQRAFGGHTRKRLVHIGDRTGLELIRTLQDKAVHAGIDVVMECAITRLLTDRGARLRCVRLLARHGRVRRLLGARRGARHRRRRPVLAGHVELVGVHRRRTRARVRGRRGACRHGVRPVPPHRDGVAARRHRPPGHRGDPRRGRDPAQRERRAVHGALRPRTVELSTRDVVARAIYTEVKEGRGTPRGGAFLLDVFAPSCLQTVSGCKLPSMYDQFMELAGVDITRGAYGGRAHLPLLHGRHSGVDAEDRGESRFRACSPAASALGRDERRQQAGAVQLALRPARVRKARWRRCVAARGRHAGAGVR